jgi:hypothetical protein
MAARKRAITLAQQKKIVGLLQTGHYVESACAYAGVAPSTFYLWRERGNEAATLRDQGKPVPRAELPYLHFKDAIELARLHGEAWLVEQILETAAELRTGKRGGQSWTAYMTILERTRRERWSRRERVDHGTPGDQPFPLRLDLDKLTPKQLDQLAGMLDAAGPDDPGS